MNTFILRWNPNISSYTMEKHLDIVSHINNGEFPPDFDWSVWDWQRVKIGDVFVMLQVGTDNDGIAMVGRFSSKAHEDDSWREDGSKIHYATMAVLDAWDLTKETTLAASQFERLFKQIDWHSGHSGTWLRRRVAKNLLTYLVNKMMHKGRWNEKAFAYFGLEMLTQSTTDATDKEEIHSFAQRALKKIDNLKEFFSWEDDFRRLDFKMDFGESIAQLSPDALNDTASLAQILPQIDDVALLTSAIYSKWRYDTYWRLPFEIKSENKEWFRLALEKLADLTQ